MRDIILGILIGISAMCFVLSTQPLWGDRWISSQIQWLSGGRSVVFNVRFTGCANNLMLSIAPIASNNYYDNIAVLPGALPTCMDKMQ